MLALVLFARLVEVGVEELAGNIGHAAHCATDRRAVDVDVEHAHEHADPGAGALAEFKLGRRSDVGDRLDDAVRRGDHPMRAHRRHPVGIAEEVEAPDFGSSWDFDKGN